MTRLDELVSEYRRACDGFRWEVPDAFNFGRDVVDRYAAADPGRPALLWREASGHERRLSFAAVREGSDRVARGSTTSGCGPASR